MAKLIKARRKPTSVRQTYSEPITCPHCGGQAYLMRRTLHPKIKGEIWTFECKDFGKQAEKSKLHYTEYVASAYRCLRESFLDGTRTLRAWGDPMLMPPRAETAFAIPYRR